MTEELACRYCFDSDKRENLISPCKCNGTMKWIHRHCLDDWRIEGKVKNCFRSCPECLFVYKMRPRSSFSTLKFNKSYVFFYVLLDICIFLFLSSCVGYIAGRIIHYMDENHAICLPDCQLPEPTRTEGFVGPLCRLCPPLQTFFGFNTTTSFSMTTYSYISLSWAIYSSVIRYFMILYRLLTILRPHYFGYEVTELSIFQTVMYGDRLMGTFLFGKFIIDIARKRIKNIGFEECTKDLVIVDLQNEEENTSETVIKQEDIDRVLVNVTFWKRFT